MSGIVKATCTASTCEATFDGTVQAYLAWDLAHREVCPTPFVRPVPQAIGGQGSEPVDPLMVHVAPCRSCAALMCTACLGASWDPVSEETIGCVCKLAGHPGPWPMVPK